MFRPVRKRRKGKEKQNKRGGYVSSMLRKRREEKRRATSRTYRGQGLLGRPVVFRIYDRSQINSCSGQIGKRGGAKIVCEEFSPTKKKWRDTKGRSPWGEQMPSNRGHHGLGFEEKVQKEFTSLLQREVDSPQEWVTGGAGGRRRKPQRKSIPNTEISIEKKNLVTRPKVDCKTEENGKGEKYLWMGA